MSNYRIFTVLAVGGTFLLLAGMHGGYEAGLSQNQVTYSTFGTGYQVLVNSYFWLFLLTIVYTIVAKVPSEIISRAVCLITAVPMIYACQIIYLQKAESLSNGGSFPALMRSTLPLDSLCAVLLSVLFLTDIWSLYRIVADRATGSTR